MTTNKNVTHHQDQTNLGAKQNDLYKLPAHRVHECLCVSKCHKHMIVAHYCAAYYEAKGTLSCTCRRGASDWMMCAGSYKATTSHTVTATSDKHTAGASQTVATSSHRAMLM